MIQTKHPVVYTTGCFVCLFGEAPEQNGVIRNPLEHHGISTIAPARLHR